MTHHLRATKLGEGYRNKKVYGRLMRKIDKGSHQVKNNNCWYPQARRREHKSYPNVTNVERKRLSESVKGPDRNKYDASESTG